jgi:hypothetical protein
MTRADPRGGPTANRLTPMRPTDRRPYNGAMSMVEQPEESHLRLFTADDERLWESRPRLTSEEFALEDVTDEEWDAFYAALAEA